MSGRDRGFTLIEMVVVVAIIVALAGVLVPIVTNELMDARKTTAQADVNRLATAVTQFIKDTSYAPTGKNGALSYHYLHSEGTEPTANSFASARGSDLRNFLTTNALGTQGWKGPYLQELGADPWGSQYLVNVHGFATSEERAWVLSSGPNRKVDTGVADTSPRGDDIAIFLE
ncbi:MAG: type II secretion system protein GspG [Planctomycetota bacterium]